MFRMLILVALILPLAFGCGKNEEPKGAVLKKPMPLKVLEAAVMGQPTEVVVQKLGPPDRSESGGPAPVWWFYDGAVEEKGKVWQAWLWITHGKVVEVRLFSPVP